eukprot:jgi/Phyca11/508295/fgenesh2_kg.PHYCAscaffold_33_\
MLLMCKLLLSVSSPASSSSPGLPSGFVLELRSNEFLCCNDGDLSGTDDASAID